MGFKWHEARRLLPQFVACLERQGAASITTERAVRWATPPRHVQPAEWARRLRLGRGCAPYRSAVAPTTEIPPPALLPYRPQRRAPDRYRDAEIAQLVPAASHLPSPRGLRAHTDATAFGGLATTGLRSSELVALENADSDLTEGRLTLRHTKFGTSRWLPLHRTTPQALCRYVTRRDRVYPIPNSPSLFVSAQGTRLSSWVVRATFVQRSRQLGWRGPTDSHGPRVHDLRHRFAVQTLVRWYRAGIDVERHLPELSTYLGHVKVSDT
jgi:integrase/recombinase XerD